MHQNPAFPESNFLSLTFMEALSRVSKIYAGDQQSLHHGQQPLRGREAQSLLR